MKKISCGPFIYENTKYKDVLKKEEMGVYPHFPSPRALDKFLNPDYTHEEKKSISPKNVQLRNSKRAFNDKFIKETPFKAF